MTTVGLGAVSGVSAAEVLAAVDAVLPSGTIDVRIATLDVRAAEPGVRAAAARRLSVETHVGYLDAILDGFEAAIRYADPRPASRSEPGRAKTACGLGEQSD